MPFAVTAAGLDVPDGSNRKAGIVLLALALVVLRHR